ncbi:hypothetical protein D3C74_396850 [compost metagenome]
MGFVIQDGRLEMSTVMFHCFFAAWCPEELGKRIRRPLRSCNSRTFGAGTQQPHFGYRWNRWSGYQRRKPMIFRQLLVEVSAQIRNLLWEELYIR